MKHYGIRFKIRMPESDSHGDKDRYLVWVVSKDGEFMETDIAEATKEIEAMDIKVIECRKHREITQEEFEAGSCEL